MSKPVKYNPYPPHTVKVCVFQGHKSISFNDAIELLKDIYSKEDIKKVQQRIIESFKQ